MTAFTRTDKSRLNKWWQTIDRYLLFCSLLLLSIGTMLVFSSGTVAAEDDNLDSYYYVFKHVTFVILSVFIIFTVSLIDCKATQKICLYMFPLSLVALVATVLIGYESGGARRWISLGFVGVQPVESVKPLLIIFFAYILSSKEKFSTSISLLLSFLTVLLVVSILWLQPDIGQTLLILALWIMMLFLGGIHIRYILSALGMTILAGFYAYQKYDHVSRRIKDFLSGGMEQTGQAARAIESFTQGGIFGVGAGKGEVKLRLPEPHTDYIFSVAGEEFGIFFCVIIVLLFVVLVMRGVSRALNIETYSLQLASIGLVFWIGFQAFINMAVNLSLLPPKGITLPFISYGGSSLIGVAFAMGCILSFTRKGINKEE